MPVFDRFIQSSEVRTGRALFENGETFGHLLILAFQRVDEVARLTRFGLLELLLELALIATGQSECLAGRISVRNIVPGVFVVVVNIAAGLIALDRKSVV